MNLEGETAVNKSYHAIRRQGKVNEQKLATFLATNGQGLLPMVDMFEQSQIACDQLIYVTGRAAIQAVLKLSAAQVAGGPEQQGKRRPKNMVFYGRQASQMMLSYRKLQVERPAGAHQGPGPQPGSRDSRLHRHSGSVAVVQVHIGVVVARRLSA